MKKIFIIFVVILMFLFSFTGCTTGNTDNNSDGTNNGNNANNGNNNGNTTGNNTNTNGEEVIGRLVGISKDEIKVSTNGKTNTYKISGDKVKDYYLGETVVIKGNENNYTVSSYDKYNFDARYTEEGDLITRATGTIKDIGDKFITATTELGELTIMNPGNFNLPLNSNVIVDYVTTKEGNKIVSYYDESTRMDLKIKNITRDADGRMVLVVTDANNKEYDLTLNHDVVMNVAHSTLKVGDSIKVYPTSIGDENPPKIKANMVIK